MKVLAINVPNVKTVNGRLHTGPNSGSRWPWTAEGSEFHGYAPFPFSMAYMVAYLQAHGVVADLYDAVAMKHTNLNTVRQTILDYRPSIAVFDVSTPVFDLTNEIAAWTKNTIESKVVFCGPHMAAFANDCKALPHVDHCVIGELERPLLDLVQRYPNGEGIYERWSLENLDTLPNGDNFLPYRDWSILGNYYDPSMDTPRTQVQINTSRSCPFHCTYCTTSTSFEKAKYRARSAEMVIDEFRQLKTKLGNGFGSIFFDDSTWNLGPTRIKAICKGLKDLGLPWTMMGRIDCSDIETYKLMVDSGCVGMRFGVETFNQQVSDNVKKHMDVEVAYRNLEAIVTTFSNMEFHFTTMKNLPGEPTGSWNRDQQLLKHLQELGGQRNNRIHWQISDCIPFPGTELWEELVQINSEALTDFSKYDGHPSNNEKLAQTIGWLGDNYAPKPSKYSGMGKPSNMPTL